MRIALKVTSSNENCNGGCEFALVDLTPDLAALALRRISALKAQKELDPGIDETHYWAYFVDCYFDPWAESRIDQEEVEGDGVAVGTCLMSFRSRRTESSGSPQASGCRPAKGQPWNARRW